MFNPFTVDPEVFCSAAMKQVAAVVPALDVSLKAVEFHCPFVVVLPTGSALTVPNWLVMALAARVFTKVSKPAKSVAVAPLPGMIVVDHSLAGGSAPNERVPLPNEPKGMPAAGALVTSHAGNKAQAQSM
jgi:hypothetical protein